MAKFAEEPIHALAEDASGKVPPLAQTDLQIAKVRSPS